MKFKIIKKDSSSKARLGSLETSHGTLETPFFMPVGTRGAVKALINEQLLSLNVPMIASNAYHLMLRPGISLIAQAGGLHAFMNWQRPILTDSGGFQVYSLARLSQVTAEGVHFRSHIDGANCFLSPEESMRMQKELGSDIAMMFDQCLAPDSEKFLIEESLHRTHLWAQRCRDYPLHKQQTLFGIVQGGDYPDLRQRSAETLTQLDFDGYALGGLGLSTNINELIEATEPLLPQDKPRYLMGVGTPRNLVEAVMRGIDMFDCVLPTRDGRTGTAFTWSGKVAVKAGRYREDYTPIDPQLDCYTSHFSRAYIHHLLHVHEIAGATLMTLQNIAFYMDFMRILREEIREDTLGEFYQRICKIYP